MTHISSDLVYNAARQEAITVRGDRLLKWDVSGTPVLIDEFPITSLIPEGLSVAGQEVNSKETRVDEHLSAVHLAVGLQGSVLAIAPLTIHPKCPIELRTWEDWHLLQRIELEHQAYEEDLSIDDPFSGHEACPYISALTVTPCSTYLVVVEWTGDLHLIQLASGKIFRWQRRWPDGSDQIAIDLAQQFLVWNRVDQDETFDLFRIDDIAGDRLSYVGKFDGGSRYHRGAVVFSPFADAIAHTDLCQTLRLSYRTFDRNSLLHQPALSNSDTRERWNHSPASILWQRDFPPFQHPHNDTNPWRSCLAFWDDQTLIVAADQTITLVETQTGEIQASYTTPSIIQAIAIDPERNYILATTQRGLVKVNLDQFEAHDNYTRSLLYEFLQDSAEVAPGDDPGGDRPLPSSAPNDTFISAVLEPYLFWTLVGVAGGLLIVVILILLD